MRTEATTRPLIANAGDLAEPLDGAAATGAATGASTGAATGSGQLQLPPKLVIEFDQASQRFVQTLVDDVAHVVLRRYPDEGQLAFSRGVNAYVRAMRHNHV